MSDRTAPLLEVRGLVKRFGGLTAVDQLDLDVWRGEILGVIGPNGAGKSTTFGLIAGALRATAGTIRLCGERVSGEPPHQIAARGILRTFQHNQLFAGMSVRDNVLVGMHTRFGASLAQVLAGTPSSRRAESAARGRADELIEFIGLAAWRESSVKTLTFGQGRLLEAARALAGEPKLILFDEPAAGLTLAECDRLSQVIRSIAQRGISVLLIEHDMHFLLPLAERVVVLNFGRKLADGTPQAIRADRAVIAAYLGEPGRAGAVNHA